MRLVLLSGGSGKRLWPLSNDARSKQFLRILEGENGRTVSMVQRVYSQLGVIGLEKQAIIATSKSQVEMIQAQLADNIPVVVEPERRDTFPAIALAAAYLYSNENVDINEVITVLPVDPYVDVKFFEVISGLDTIVKDSNCDIALIGVKPTYPSSKYGYIVPKMKGMDNCDFYEVSHFSEKPPEEVANELIKQQALWNCGVFAFRLGYIIQMISDLGLPVDYDELTNCYKLLPKNSFDYEVVEKAKNIVTVSYDGYWKDLGTWNTLTEEMSYNVIGKGKISEDSNNTHLINELEIPVAILGVSNLLVAASPDGILVTKKSESPRLKELVTDFVQRPMYEEKRWGSFKILDHTTFEGYEVITKKIRLKEDKNLSYQYHLKRNETWNVLNGFGEVLIDGELKKVSPGDIVVIPPGSKHGVKAISELEILEIQNGESIDRNDIYRIEENWDKILKIHHKINKEENRV